MQISNLLMPSCIRYVQRDKRRMRMLLFTLFTRRCLHRNVTFTPMIFIKLIRIDGKTLIAITIGVDLRQRTKARLCAQSGNRFARERIGAIHADHLHIFFPSRQDVYMVDNEYRFHWLRI
jgi:hypothetical protein